MDTCILMAESLHGSPETVTILLICYTPIQNKKLKKKQKKCAYRDGLSNRIEVNDTQQLGVEYFFFLGLDRYKFLYIKWINNKDLLYSTDNYI